MLVVLMVPWRSAPPHRDDFVSPKALKTLETGENPWRLEAF